MPLTPEDSLWLAVLQGEPELHGKADAEIRSDLKENGFPERLVEEFLRVRGLPAEKQ